MAKKTKAKVAKPKYVTKAVLLEQTFQKALDEAGKSIKENLVIAKSALKDKDPKNVKKALKALSEAQKLSDKSGIPYQSEVVALGAKSVIGMVNHHVPESYFKLFGTLDPKKVSKLVNVAPYALGWKDPNVVRDEYPDDEYDEDENYDDE